MVFSIIGLSGSSRCPKKKKKKKLEAEIVSQGSYAAVCLARDSWGVTAEILLYLFYFINPAKTIK